MVVLQVQNAKQMNSGLKHALETSLEDFRLPEVQRTGRTSDVRRVVFPALNDILGSFI